MLAGVSVVLGWVPVVVVEVVVVMLVLSCKVEVVMTGEVVNSSVVGAGGAGVLQR